MDSADPQTITTALNAQGALLGQHDQQLQETSAALNNITQQLQLLTAAVSRLTTGPVPAPPSGSSPAPGSAPRGAAGNPPPREVTVATPKAYDGNPETCQSFLMQCGIVFNSQPAMYASDRARVSYVLNLLTDRALAWGTSVWQLDQNLEASYPHFVDSLQRVFDHPDQGPSADGRLLTLRQGSRTVTDFSIEFQTLAARSGWNDKALQAAFAKGLSNVIKDELALREEPASLEDLINVAIKLDQRLRERRRERGGREDYTSRQPWRAEFSPSDRFPGSSNPPSGATLSRGRSPPVDAEEPMQLGRSRVTERQRRLREGACLYCGSSDHHIATCSVRPKEQTRQ